MNYDPMNNYVHINFNNLPPDKFVLIGQHQYTRTESGVVVFGNHRKFPVPAGRLVSARIGLVTTVPGEGTMKLPEGEVVVRTLSGAIVKIGDSLPNAQTVRVETPNTGGVSNWGGIELCFENHPSFAGIPDKKGETVWVMEYGSYSDRHVVGLFSSKEKLTAYLEEFRLSGDGEVRVEEYSLNELVPPASMHSYNVAMTEGGDTIHIGRAAHKPESDSVHKCMLRDLHYDIYDYRLSKSDSPNSVALRTICWARDEEHAVKIAKERHTAYLTLQLVTVPA